MDCWCGWVASAPAGASSVAWAAGDHMRKAIYTRKSWQTREKNSTAFFCSDGNSGISEWDNSTLPIADEVAGLDDVLSLLSSEMPAPRKSQKHSGIKKE